MRNGPSCPRPLLAVLLLLASAPAAAEIVVDGRLDEPEWAQAQVFSEMLSLQPLTGERSDKHPTEVRLLSTPEGLVFGFRNAQPAAIERTRQRFRRDEGGQVDRVNVVIDYDNNGRTAYNFMVALSGSISDETVTNENVFRSDWDGIWDSAVHEEGDVWFVEMRIPWSTVSMAPVDGDTRAIGLYVDRVVGTTGERVGWPNASWQRPTYVSDFAEVQVRQYSDSLLAITPYVVGAYDIANGGHDFKAGADIFWKPGGPHQLTAAINPDFGQVESDDLVVNFSAIETFFSDKRPFFTENQGLFNIVLPRGTQPIYTRRVGGPADDGSGAAEIDLALKLTGNVGGIDYGLMAASERGDGGSDFAALRLLRSGERGAFGGLWTHVERPFLDRTADVLMFDPIWRPNERWTWSGHLFTSRIREAGGVRNGYGGVVSFSFVPDERWQHSGYLLRYDRDVNLNDFGFQDRNNHMRAQYNASRRFTGLPESSAYSSHRWGLETAAVRNGDGHLLFSKLNINRGSERRDGGEEWFFVEGNFNFKDDLISRGNGIVHYGFRLYAGWERSIPRRGRWGYYHNINFAADGATHPFKGGLGVRYDFEPTFHVNDHLNFPLSVSLWASPDWLLWEGGNRLASYRTRWVELGAGVEWLIGEKQELRVKMQSISADLEPVQAWRVPLGGGALQPAADLYADRAIRSLGFQVRYRYKIGPLSDFFIVYARGGFQIEDSPDGFGLGQQLADALALKDDEQFLMKLSYRFAW